MENTYNYFFSSTPQVLAAILGLFWVFIIFKNNEIKDDMNDLKNELFNAMRNHFEPMRSFDLDWKRHIKQLIEIRDIEQIFREIPNIVSYANENSIPELKNIANSVLERHFDEHHLLGELLRNTIKVSKITALTIIYCLIMIIFGTFINHCLFWSIIAFVPAIVMSINILNTLISIIKYSFSD